MKKDEIKEEDRNEIGRMRGDTNERERGSEKSVV